jgi:hypothetical protein
MLLAVTGLDVALVGALAGERLPQRRGALARPQRPSADGVRRLAYADVSTEAQKGCTRELVAAVHALRVDVRSV